MRPLRATFVVLGQHLGPECCPPLKGPSCPPNESPDWRGFPRWAVLGSNQYPQLVDSERCSPRFAGVRSRRMVERSLKASERFSERERTPSVAIVATRLPTTSAGARAAKRCPGPLVARLLKPRLVVLRF
jgi:hypothetical protein